MIYEFTKKGLESMFSIEGKFFRTLTKIADFLILGFLMIIFSLPIITMGASITAMFYVGMKLVRDEESYVFKDFFKSWKQNLKQSIFMELIIVVLAAFLITDIRICYQWANAEGSTFARLLMFAVIGFLLVLSGVVLYAFPMLAKFENTVIKTLKNALILCVHHLPQTLIMLLATYGIIYFSLSYFLVLILTIPFICYIDSYVLARIMLPYTKQAQVNIDDEQDSSDEAEEI